MRNTIVKWDLFIIYRKLNFIWRNSIGHAKGKAIKSERAERARQRTTGRFFRKIIIIIMYSIHLTNIYQFSQIKEIAGINSSERSERDNAPREILTKVMFIFTIQFLENKCVVLITVLVNISNGGNQARNPGPRFLHNSKGKKCLCFLIQNKKQISFKFYIC